MPRAEAAFEVRGAARRPLLGGGILLAPALAALSVGALVLAVNQPPAPEPYPGAGCADAPELTEHCVHVLSGVGARTGLPTPDEFGGWFVDKLADRAVPHYSGLGTDPLFLPDSGSDFWRSPASEPTDPDPRELVARGLRDHLGGASPGMSTERYVRWLAEHERPTVAPPSWVEEVKDRLWAEVEKQLQDDRWMNLRFGSAPARVEPPATTWTLRELDERYDGLELVRMVVARQNGIRVKEITADVAAAGADLYEARVRATLRKREQAAERRARRHLLTGVGLTVASSACWTGLFLLVGVWAWRRRPLEIVAGPHALRVGDRVIPWSEVRAPDWTCEQDPGVWLRDGRLTLRGYELDEELAEALDHATRVAIALADPTPPDPEQVAALERLGTAAQRGTGQTTG